MLVQNSHIRVLLVLVFIFEDQKHGTKFKMSSHPCLYSQTSLRFPFFYLYGVGEAFQREKAFSTWKTTQCSLEEGISA